MYSFTQLICTKNNTIQCNVSDSDIFFSSLSVVAQHAKGDDVARVFVTRPRLVGYVEAATGMNLEYHDN